MHLHLLGTGAALSDASRTTTMLALEGTDSVVVIDCGGDVIQRLLSAGIDLDLIELLLLSHEHADHVSGFPLFMEKLWLSGRRRPIQVRGPSSALDQARRAFATFNTSGWEGLPEIEWGPVPLEEEATVYEGDEWQITSSPGTHSVPVAGFRIRHSPSGRVVTYSADTEPAPAIERLARGADVLVHEATGDFKGHSSAVQAAEVARAAGVRKLVLVHLPPEIDEEEIVAAMEHFSEIVIGTDGERLAL